MKQLMGLALLAAAAWFLLNTVVDLVHVSPVPDESNVGVFLFAGAAFVCLVLGILGLRGRARKVMGLTLLVTGGYLLLDVLEMTMAEGSWSEAVASIVPFTSGSPLRLPEQRLVSDDDRMDTVSGNRAPLDFATQMEIEWDDAGVPAPEEMSMKRFLGPGSFWRLQLDGESSAITRGSRSFSGPGDAWKVKVDSGLGSGTIRLRGRQGTWRARTSLKTRTAPVSITWNGSPGRSETMHMRRVSVDGDVFSLKLDGEEALSQDESSFEHPHGDWDVRITEVDRETLAGTIRWRRAKPAALVEGKWTASVKNRSTDLVGGLRWLEEQNCLRFLGAICVVLGFLGLLFGRRRPRDTATVA